MSVSKKVAGEKKKMKQKNKITSDESLTPASFPPISVETTDGNSEEIDYSSK